MPDLTSDDTWLDAPAHCENGSNLIDDEAIKRAVIDQVIALVTNGLFVGDERDGTAPPLTLENRFTEMIRLYAQAQRVRWIGLPLAELCAEIEASAEYEDARKAYVKNAQAKAQRDAARLPRLPQDRQAIAAAARHCRDQGLTAEGAWRELNKNAFTTDDGYTVEVVGSNRDPSKQRMRVLHADGTQTKRAISLKTWRRYWTAAGAN
jgi:hypothetical protein